MVRRRMTLAGIAGPNRSGERLSCAASPRLQAERRAARTGLSDEHEPPRPRSSSCAGVQHPALGPLLGRINNGRMQSSQG